MSRPFVSKLSAGDYRWREGGGEGGAWRVWRSEKVTKRERVWKWREWKIEKKENENDVGMMKKYRKEGMGI